MINFEAAINYDALNNLSLEELRAVKKTLSFVPNKQKLYDCDYIAHLIAKYHDKGGEVITIEEGTLGYGFMIMFGEGLKTTIVKEVYINEWSSGHTIRMYNKMPKKYEQMITAFYESEE